MSDENRSKLRKVLDELAEMQSPGTSYSPALTPRTVAAEVTPDGVLHAVQLKRQPEGGEVSILRYLKFDPRQDERPDWTVICEGIRQAGFPWVMAIEDVVDAGFQGTLDGSEAQRRTFARQCYWIHLSQGRGADPVRILERIRDAVATGISPSGDLYVLSREWYSPAEEPVKIGLILSRLRPGRAQAQPVAVPGSDASGTSPVDYAVFADSGGLVHITYDGISREGVKELLYVALDPRGGSAPFLRAIAPATRYPVLSRILADPRGRLLLFHLHRARKDSLETETQVFELGAVDVKNARSRYYLVDYFLRLHTIEFDREGRLQHTADRAGRSH